MLTPHSKCFAFLMPLCASYLLSLTLISFAILFIVKLGVEVIDLKKKTAKDISTFPFSKPADSKRLG